MSRGLESIEKPKGKTKAEDNSKLVLIHTIRSTDLANTIIDTLDNLIYEELGCKDGEYDLYVCSEGLSMASKGDATLDLATYKGVLLSKIYEHYGDNLCRLFTYSPPTLKATAGCSKKELQKDKRNMIMAFAREPIDAPLLRAINDGSLILKTNFVEGVDDISDSYWALRTMIKKEKLQFP